MAGHISPYETCTPSSSGRVQVGEVENFFDTQGVNLHQAYREETYWLADQRRFMSGREPPIQYYSCHLPTAQEY